MLKITKRKLRPKRPKSDNIEAKFSIARPVVNITSIMIRVIVVKRCKLNNQSEQYECKSLLGNILLKGTWRVLMHGKKSKRRFRRI